MLDTEGLRVNKTEYPPMKWVDDLSESVKNSITEVLDRCNDYYNMIPELKGGNQNDTKES